MKYQDFADLYQLEETMWWFVGMQHITKALLDPFLESRCDRILDTGCGTGGMLDCLARYRSDQGVVFGLDYDHGALQFCRLRRKTNLVHASVTDIPFCSDSFDLITNFDVLVQLPANSRRAAIAELFRAAKPGAVVFVRAAAYRWLRSGHDRALGSHWRYTRRELKGSMEDAGFETLRMSYANFLLLPLAIVNRLLLKPLAVVHQGSDVRAPKLRLANRFFTLALCLEAALLRMGLNFPCGVSVICVAKKPFDAAPDT